LLATQTVAQTKRRGRTQKARKHHISHLHADRLSPFHRDLLCVPVSDSALRPKATLSSPRRIRRSGCGRSGCRRVRACEARPILTLADIENAPSALHPIIWWNRRSALRAVDRCRGSAIAVERTTRRLKAGGSVVEHSKRMGGGYSSKLASARITWKAWRWFIAPNDIPWEIAR